MFTGIVADTGTIGAVRTDEDGRRIRIEDVDFGPFDHGESIAVNGVCLTVEEHGPDWFSVFTASETLDKTTLGGLAAGDPVNLERPVPADGHFDGHVVQGHVDTTTEVVAIDSVGEDWTFTFAQPTGFEQYVAHKGSVTIDGVSLTVAALDDEAGTFEVAIIPTTYDETLFGEYAVGDRVNLEVDVIAKYVERLAERGTDPQRSSL